MNPTLPEQVAQIVTTYRYWSHAERRILPSITDQIISYLADGEGNRFIAEFSQRVVIPRLPIEESHP